MALFYLAIKSIGRSAGRSATAAAAYRAGERIRDERTGKLHNYSRRRDVVHSEIFLPSRISINQAAWARDRPNLWNAAEAAERARNSRVAREVQVMLPPELTPAQRLELARGFSRELADRYQAAVDLAVHEPRAGHDPRNHHAHLLMTTRVVTEAGLGPKTGLDRQMADTLRGLRAEWAKETVAVRERWASRVNEALQTAGIEARIDHRSLKDQGIDRVPQPYIPFVAYQQERRGMRSEVAERIRQRYRERVAAHVAAHTAGSPVTSTLSAAERGAASDTAPASLAQDSGGLEDLRRRAREAWLQLRREASLTGSVSPAEPASPSKQRAAQGPRAARRAASAGASRAVAAESPDEDLGL